MLGREERRDELGWTGHEVELSLRWADLASALEQELESLVARSWFCTGSQVGDSAFAAADVS